MDVSSARDHRRPLRFRPPFGPKAEAVGYVFEQGSESVYFAGDTDMFPAMAELAGVDLALLPVWGWGPRLGPGHMDPERAADALGVIRPRATVPIHWGTLWPVGMGRVTPRALESGRRSTLRGRGRAKPRTPRPRHASWRDRAYPALAARRGTSTVQSWVSTGSPPWRVVTRGHEVAALGRRLDGRISSDVALARSRSPARTGFK